MEVPPHVPPQAVFQSLNRFFESVVDSAVAAAVNAGSETRFGVQAGITVPPGLPLNYSASVAIEGRAQLSVVETGAWPQDSQTFRASVQIQQDDRVAVQRTLLNRIYGPSRYAEHLPDGMRGPLEQARGRRVSPAQSSTTRAPFSKGVHSCESCQRLICRSARSSPHIEAQGQPASAFGHELIRTNDGRRHVSHPLPGSADPSACRARQGTFIFQPTCD